MFAECCVMSWCVRCERLRRGGTAAEGGRRKAEGGRAGAKRKTTTPHSDVGNIKNVLTHKRLTLSEIFGSQDFEHGQS